MAPNGLVAAADTTGEVEVEDTDAKARAEDEDDVVGMAAMPPIVLLLGVAEVVVSSGTTALGVDPMVAAAPAMSELEDVAKEVVVVPDEDGVKVIKAIGGDEIEGSEKVAGAPEAVTVAVTVTVIVTVTAPAIPGVEDVDPNDEEPDSVAPMVGVGVAIGKGAKGEADNELLVLWEVAEVVVVVVVVAALIGTGTALGRLKAKTDEDEDAVSV